MRKAKEIALELNMFIVENQNNIEAVKIKIGKLAKEFASDTEELIKSRHAKSDSALLAILKETNQRWNATARRCEALATDGFKKFILHDMPFMRKLWV